MIEDAKWCPLCSTLNAIADDICRNPKCSCVFAGDELGAKLEPETIDTESQNLGRDVIEGRLRALLEKPAEEVDSRKEDRRVLLVRIGWSVVAVLCGAVFLAYGVFFTRTFGGRGGFWLGLITLFGGAGCLFGLILFVKSLLWFLRPPKFTTPKQVADCFYGELLGSGKGSVERAWSCLDSGARAQFKSLRDFKEYWKSRQAEMKKWALDRTAPLLAKRPKGQRGERHCAIKLKSIQIASVDGRTANLRGEVLVFVWELVAARKDIAGNPIFVSISYGDFVLPQSKTLLMGPDRWYLTSGTLDGPKT